jgi:hypothetical protein
LGTDKTTEGNLLTATSAAVDWGDAPAWAATIVAVIALIVSAVAATFSWKSLRWEKLSAEAAGRSAEAAERSNLLAQRALDARAAGNSGELIATEPAACEQLDVHWRIENPSGNRYVLRNVGTDTAEHVEVDASQAGRVTRNLPQDAVIRPGEGADMLIMGTWGHPVPNQLYVRWAGQPEWVAVPISA